MMQSRTLVRGLVLATLALTSVGTLLLAQQFGGRGGRNMGRSPMPNAPYDGRYTFARVRFEPFSGGRDLKWDHDYPRAEIHFMKILRELTTVRPRLEGGNIYAFDEPEIFKYPIAYVSEPGFWTLSETEIVSLRKYIAKGGFLIFDDFADAYEWANFEARMREVLPNVNIVRLDASHPIFDSFFHIEEKTLVMQHPYRYVSAEFWGIYEDNDPSKRLIAIINFNNDIGDYWEFSDEGFLPVELSNEAYKLGVNYVVYALTH
ncbi:MAG TPA: DUF4159 domain-containing protein [Gemmatimonadaceae bacterium]|nr:DUF4159 domain-containing protein [Gemmatimonadaceae bacterium]